MKLRDGAARALRVTISRADAATSKTTLAANPAGTQGASSAWSIHHKRKKSAAAEAVAMSIYAAVDAPRVARALELELSTGVATMLPLAF